MESLLGSPPLAPETAAPSSPSPPVAEGSPEAPHSLYIDVALPLPLFQTFTYLVDNPARPVELGTRVIVPFRGRRVVGVSTGSRKGPPPAGAAIKSVLSWPDAGPIIDPGMLALCRWVAEYYAAPLGVVLRSALPAALIGEGRPGAVRKTRRVAVVREELPSLLERDSRFARARRQREVFEYLESIGGRSPVEHLVLQLRCSQAILRGLRASGLIDIVDEEVDRDPFAGRPRQPLANHVPTGAQRDAIGALVGARPGEVALLHGITGSGKTLVYIELLREVVDVRGQSAIVLVPEIALTPQTVDRFRAVFGDRVAVLHSGLSVGERYDAWRALQSGAKRIAVGARSAIFAPLQDLGAIIVDEEHEASYKQSESPRYHAREVAVIRGRQSGARVVLGSATPSLESWANAVAGKYRYLTLPDRVGGGRLPAVEVVDMRRPAYPAGALSTADRDPFSAVISVPLEVALRATLGRGEQSILLLNRRGYAAFIQCDACGSVSVCPSCSITLTYHRTPERLLCHYCQYQEAPPTRCARCSAPMLRRGLGTQKVERLLGERFPAARLARMDVDTTSGKWAHAEILDRVARGEVDILLGTQMIAKGLDFANVTLVGVIDADVGINLPDFRASERCFQLLSQVAGRAGRGPKGGMVVIQTRVPGHHAVQCAVEHDYAGFVRQELIGRRDPPYPPLVRLANVVFSGLDESAVAELAERGGDWVRRLAAQELEGIQVVGPAPCPIERIKKRWRWHLLLKADGAGALTRLADYMVRRFPIPTSGGMRMAFDRDPVALL